MTYKLLPDEKAPFHLLLVPIKTTTINQSPPIYSNTTPPLQPLLQALSERVWNIGPTGFR